ncbi:Hypothetical predicted protein [Podarcis lilfordi]|uniref:Uncharacterized protein n=1 Tax=Podarcis lilfordi TaxID=74358 RepID=A0AA35L1W7_9SAUR|nr:Hypothetical predicted protein [Podarcis lilfordi]
MEKKPRPGQKTTFPDSLRTPRAHAPKVSARVTFLPRGDQEEPRKDGGEEGEELHFPPSPFPVLQPSKCRACATERPGSSVRPLNPRRSVSRSAGGVWEGRARRASNLRACLRRWWRRRRNQ